MGWYLCFFFGSVRVPSCTNMLEHGMKALCKHKFNISVFNQLRFQQCALPLVCGELSWQQPGLYGDSHEFPLANNTGFHLGLGTLIKSLSHMYLILGSLFCIRFPY